MKEHRQEQQVGFEDLLATPEMAELRNALQHDAADSPAKLARDIQVSKEFGSWYSQQLDSVVTKQNYRQVARIENGDEVTCLQVLPDGRIFAGGGTQTSYPNGMSAPPLFISPSVYGFFMMHRREVGFIRVWSSHGPGEWASEMLQQPGELMCLKVLPDGRMIGGGCSRFMDGVAPTMVYRSVFIWSAAPDREWSCQELLTSGPTTSSSGRVTRIQALPDGRIILGGDGCVLGDATSSQVFISREGVDGLWDHVNLHGLTASVKGLLTLPDGRIFSAHYRGKMFIWSEQSDGSWCSKELAMHHKGSQCFHALTATKIVSGTDDGQLCILSESADGSWNSEIFKGHQSRVTCLQVLPDGRIVSGGEDSRILISSKQPGGLWASDVLDGHQSTVTCLQVLPDGRIVSGSSDGTLRIWDGDVTGAGT